MNTFERRHCVLYNHQMSWKILCRVYCSLLQNRLCWWMWVDIIYTKPFLVINNGILLIINLGKTHPRHSLWSLVRFQLISVTFRFLRMKCQLTRTREALPIIVEQASQETLAFEIFMVEGRSFILSTEKEYLPITIS